MEEIKEIEPEPKRCRECQKILSKYNTSGYCHPCYHLSEQYHEYQRKKQLQYYQEGRYKDWVKKYNQKPEVKEKRRIYIRTYAKDHRKELNEYKSNWLRKKMAKEKLNAQSENVKEA